MPACNTPNLTTGRRAKLEHFRTGKRTQRTPVAANAHQPKLGPSLVAQLSQIRAQISFRVLITIAASFGLGAALENTHISNLIADALTVLSRSLPQVVFLGIIFLCTSLLSCIVSNSATVVLLYSVLRSVHVPGLSASRMMLVMMIGASSAFATPLGYQTNLLVVSRGGYRFGDFAYLGGLLTIVVGTCVSVLAWIMPESILS